MAAHAAVCPTALEKIVLGLFAPTTTVLQVGLLNLSTFSLPQ
jgi:hypothetical protein